MRRISIASFVFVFFHACFGGTIDQIRESLIPSEIAEHFTRFLAEDEAYGYVWLATAVGFFILFF